MPELNQNIDQDFLPQRYSPDNNILLGSKYSKIDHKPMRLINKTPLSSSLPFFHINIFSKIFSKISAPKTFNVTCDTFR